VGALVLDKYRAASAGFSDRLLGQDDGGFSAQQSWRGFLCFSYANSVENIEKALEWIGEAAARL